MKKALMVTAVILFIAVIPILNAQPVAWWRMEGAQGASITNQTVSSEINADFMVGKAHANSGGKMELRAEVPAAYIYDPIAKVSYTNATSLAVSDNGTASDCLEIPCDTSRLAFASFTVELFVRPAGEQKFKAGDVLPIFKKTRQDDNAAEFEISVGRSGLPRSYNWLQAGVTAPGEDSQELARNRYGGITHITDGKTWRHLALAYDATNNKAKFYCDYDLIATLSPAAPLTPFDAGSLLIGGQPNGRGVSGLIDEVRLSDGALEPWNLLRATPHELKNISFQPSDKALLPADSGYIDVKLRYGAVGDGVTDDTKAIQRAFKECADGADRVAMEYNTLYFPAGVYLVSDTCQWSRFMTVQGEGRDKTIIRLQDNCPAFINPAKPKAVIIASNWNGGQGSGSAHGNFAFDFTVDTGKGNPGAIGVQFQANNIGAMENVDIRSGDGSGAVGLDFTRPWPGPSLQKNIRIEGFNIGIKVTHKEYSLVFENLELANQKVAGIRNDGNCVSIRRLLSRNSAPAVINGDAGGMVVLLDSELTGGARENYAIENKGGLYARNIKTVGYKGAIKSPDAVIEAVNVSEYVAGKIQMMFDSPKSSLNLPVMDTPAVPYEDPKAWLNIEHFRDKVKDGDWSDAIQAAIDSGKTTLYFPANTECEVKKTVHVRGNIQRIIGLRSGISGKSSLFKETPMLAIDGTNANTVVLEMFNAKTDYGQKAFGILHASPQTLVMKHCEIAGYRTGPGVGPLFIEDMDAGSWVFANNQKIWARQLNPENRQPDVEITNNGAELWILGLKTEYESINIINNNNARTEVLGGLIYPVGNVPEGMPMFENNNSAFSVVIAESCYSKNHGIVVKDTQQGETRKFMLKDADWSGGRAKLDLYVSNPLKKLAL